MMSTHSDGSALSASTAPSAEHPQQSRWNTWGMLKAFAFRMAITYFIFSLFRRPASNPAQSDQGGLRQMPAMNMYESGTRMELYAYLAETPDFSGFNDSSALFWHLPSLVYGDWTGGQHLDGSYSKHSHIDCEKQFSGLMKNGSLYLHIYFVKAGFSPDPAAGEKYSRRTTIYKSKMLTRYKRRRLSRTVNLLTGQTDSHPDLVASASTPNNITYLPATTHWHPNLTVHLVVDHTAWTPGAVPVPLDQFIDFHHATNEYYPPVYLNDYWNMNKDYQPVNETTPILDLWLEVAPISLFKWQLYATQASKRSMFGNWFSDLNFASDGDDNDEDEQDTIKKTLVETNPWLLALTVVVSLVHSVFEMLAFKNDIQFWKSRESLEGLSVRSVFFNVFQSLIVCLYVLDNQTNFVIIVSVFVGLGIEIWKIHKVLNITIDHQSPGFLGLLPRIQVDYKSSYVESDTKKYDQMAFRYLSWLLFPMLACYCVYSLVYQEHRGWYSWILSMLYGFLLTFGFITMTPQLFINYKLKSVAHLPWRMLTYKALNTFIDDLFAFVIHMPMLYRIGCLRDDVIFFIYLYQRWIYPMDPNRVNEFGVSKEMLDSSKKSPEGEEPTAALSNSSSPKEDDDASGVRKRRAPASSETEEVEG